MNRKFWIKHPSPEKLMVGRDWTLDLNGATLSGSPTVTVVGDASLTCTFISNAGSVSSFWLEGGNTAVSGQYVSISHATSTGETLVDNIRVDCGI